MPRHLSHEALRALLEGRSKSLQEGAHLLSCRACQTRFVILDKQFAPQILAKLQDLQPLAEQLDLPGNIHLLAGSEDAFNRAHEMVAHLPELPHHERAQAVKESDLPEVYVAAAILQTVPSLIHDCPKEVARLCELGVNLLAPEQGDFEVNHKSTPGLLAELHANWANAYRVLRRLWEADLQMEEAIVYADQITDPLARGEVYKFAGLLALDHRDFENSLLLWGVAREAFKSLGRYRKTREIDFLEAANSFLAGRVVCAINQARTLFTAPHGQLDEHLRLAAGTLLVQAQTVAERYTGAYTSLRDLAVLAEMFPSGHLTAQMNWMKGLLLLRMLGPGHGENLLETARRWFIENELLFEAALVTLDTSMALCDHGEFEKAAVLAGSIVEAFSVSEGHYHALMALKCFHEAVEAGAAAEHYTQLRRYLYFAKQDPDYAYPPETP